MAYEQDAGAPDILGSSAGEENQSTVLSHGLTQTLSYLKDPEDPLQVRQAVKLAADLAWPGRLFEADSFCTSLAGVFFRGSRAYAFNMGSNRVVLCRGTKAQRLTVDHKVFDPAENEKRVPKRTALLAAEGLSRGTERSTDPHLCEQRPQVTAIKLKEAKGGAFAIVNEAVSEVLSDEVINAFVVREMMLGASMQAIAVSLASAAAYRRKHVVSVDPYSRHEPAVLLVRPPEEGDPNTRSNFSRTPLRPLGDPRTSRRIAVDPVTGRPRL